MRGPNLLSLGRRLCLNVCRSVRSTNWIHRHGLSRDRIAVTRAYACHSFRRRTMRWRPRRAVHPAPRRNIVRPFQPCRDRWGLHRQTGQRQPSAQRDSTVCSIETIAPQRPCRLTDSKTQDGRALRRYTRPRNVERTRPWIETVSRRYLSVVKCSLVCHWSLHRWWIRQLFREVVEA